MKAVRHNGKDTTVINLNLRAGFFANLTTYVSLLKYCEVNEIRGVIRLTGSTYRGSDRDDDWFERYFERLDDPRKAAASSRTRSFTFRGVRVLRLPSIGATLSLPEANRILREDSVVKRDIAGDVDAFFISEGVEPTKTLGIHYRGTDKSFESERVPYESVVIAARRILESDGPFDAVLVASDEIALVEYVSQQEIGVRVISPPYSAVGDANTAPHMMPGLDKSVLGREALITCLTLAKCSTLLRTSSYLSAWAKVFNPSLITYTLNAPYNPITFPEAQVLRLEKNFVVRDGA